MAVAPEAGEPAWPEDAVEVGRIVGAWGVKGGLRVQPYAGTPQALFSSRRWFLRPAHSTAPAGVSLPALLRVIQAREHGEGIVATVQDVADRDAAEALRGARIFVSRASFPTPEPGEYYWVDLIGLDVVNRDGLSLGEVTGLMDLGPHAVLQIRPAAPRGSELLIPFVAAYVDDVDLEARRITVDWAAAD
jgi:16S rRNA processing protein RimM